MLFLLTYVHKSYFFYNNLYNNIAKKMYKLKLPNQLLSVFLNSLAKRDVKYMVYIYWKYLI